MRAYDIISHKRDGLELGTKEIEYIIGGYLNGDTADYQMSALLMAIYLNGMSNRELADLTKAMTQSGETVDLSMISGVTVDKHSTGGVGDKTTLIIAPLVAACGVKVAKMSGRGLGHTGGTVDKLESIDGFCTDLSRERFFEIVEKVGVSVVGQSGNLVPADKLIYALRDVTATVESIPLIASSIMSKKLAAGNDCILLDVKVGSGAFMKTIEQAKELAERMVEIGKRAGKHTRALVTDMDIPLGNAIGNSLEVIEAVEVLKGGGSKELRELSIELSAQMLNLANIGDIEQCRDKVKTAIASGAGLSKFIEMVEEQGGDSSVIKDTSLFKKAAYSTSFKAKQSGYITAIDTQGCGIAAVMLGGGRLKKGDKIDHTAGIIMHKKLGDAVEIGEEIAALYSNSNNMTEAVEMMETSVIIGEKKPNARQLILEVVQ